MRNLSAASIASLPPHKWRAFLRSLSGQELKFLLFHWAFWARDDQLSPPGDWTTWLILGGRGAGKTRAGAEWVRAHVEGATPLAGGASSHVALLAETHGDARDVMVEGPSGLLAIAPPDMRPRHEPSRRRLVWPNGAMATYYSSEDPDSLRGPQFSGAWCDEYCKWRYVSETWDNLQFALRLGTRPQQVVTTTPRPIRQLKELMASDTTVVTRASTYANRAYLAEGFFDAVIKKYEGTRLGRQELDAEILEDNPDALWQRQVIEQARVPTPPPLARIVVAVDPPISSSREADACGIVVAGLGQNGDGYVLADRTVQGVSPMAWASSAVRAFHAFKADRLVAEVNQGGEMVGTVIAQVDPTVPVKMVRASRGKVARAEPVSALYEQRRVHHAGAFPELEDQMCDFDPLIVAQGATSPDRVDALVWALTDLMLGRAAAMPRLRRL